MRRRHGLVMLLLAIAIMSQQQAGVTNFLSQMYGIDSGLIALALGVPFAIGGVLMYTRWARTHLTVILLPTLVYALLAAYLALTGTGNFVPAIFYAWTYWLLIELSAHEVTDGSRCRAGAARRAVRAAGMGGRRPDAVHEHHVGAAADGQYRGIGGRAAEGRLYTPDGSAARRQPGVHGKAGNAAQRPGADAGAGANGERAERRADAQAGKRGAQDQRAGGDHRQPATKGRVDGGDHQRSGEPESGQPARPGSGAHEAARTGRQIPGIGNARAGTGTQGDAHRSGARHAVQTVRDVEAEGGGERCRVTSWW